MDAKKELKLSMLIKLPESTFDRIPKPRSRWVVNTIIEAAKHLPAIEKDDFGTEIMTFVFKQGDDIGVMKGRTASEAWDAMGWSGKPNRWAVEHEAVFQGWYVRPKTNMSALLDED